MPAEIRWYIPEHVVYLKMYDEVTIEDILEVSPKAIELIASVDTTFVHTIADTKDLKTFPTTIADYRKLFSKTAPNAGWVIFIGDNKLVRFFSSIASNFMNLRINYVKTVDEAVKFLLERDITISMASTEEMPKEL